MKTTEILFATTINSLPIEQSLFQKLFERFPNAFPILRNLLEL